MMHFLSSSFALLFVRFFICEADLNTKDEGRILAMTAKSYITELYLDGIKVSNLINEDTWYLSDEVNLSPDNRLIAIFATDASFSCAGILASVTGDYLVTDASWKCSTEAYPQWHTLGFDDSSWSDAYVIGKNDGNITTPDECSILTEISSISSNASWIWTASIANAPVYDTTVFCRGYLHLPKIYSRKKDSDCCWSLHLLQVLWFSSQRYKALCDESPCRSGGTCHRNDPQICSCPPLYYGTYCERANPLNSAALSGDILTLTCKRYSMNVTWWFTNVGGTSSSVIVSDCTVLPEFTNRYTVDKIDGACNLVIFDAQFSHAGAYTCQETSTSDVQTSAELTVLNGVQQCLPSPNPVVYGQIVTITCDLSYSGNWVPSIRWIDRYGQAVTNDTTVTTDSNVNSYIQIPAFFPSVPSFTSVSYFSELKLPNITGDIRANNTPSNTYAAVTQVVTVVCPPGFSKTSQYHCYDIIEDPLYGVDWYSAQTMCQQLYPGAYLVVISDASEQADLSGYLAVIGAVGAYWTSGFATNGCWNYAWQPLPGYVLPMNYTNWKSGEPNCLTGYESCVEISHPINDWNDNVCETIWAPLCEFELTPQ